LPVGRRAEVSLAMQALALDRLLPEGRSCLSPGRLAWTGVVRPGADCGEYTLELKAQPATPPRIVVIAPPRRPNGDGMLPHVYDDGSLCVSQPGDWRPHMLFMDTFLPWSCEWLVYYELWLATNVWFGDGPDTLDAESQARILHPYR
jgi:hypothetical protein